MDSFFLLNESIQLNNIEDLVAGCNELILIEKDLQDSYYKHESIYLTDAYEMLCYHQDQSAQFLNGFLEKEFSYMEDYLTTEEELNQKFDPYPCAFLGINFDGSEITHQKRITCNDDYLSFKEHVVSSVDKDNFWLLKKRIFPNLVICNHVEQQIVVLGNSSHFNQVIDRLKTLDKYASSWSSGAFSHKEVNRSTSLTISPESQSTLDKYENQRRFKLPDGTYEIFDLHIKTGDLRFHIYPRQIDFTVFIGYIGPHLDTIST